MYRHLRTHEEMRTGYEWNICKIIDNFNVPYAHPLSSEFPRQTYIHIQVAIHMRNLILFKGAVSILIFFYSYLSLL